MDAPKPTRLLPLNISPVQMPEHLQKFANDLLEGRVTDAAFVYRMTDGSIADAFAYDINGGGTGCVYAMLGAIVHLQREWMRVMCESRCEYVEVESDEDDE